MDRSKWEYKKLGEVCKVINGLWTGKKPPFVNVGVIRNANFTKTCELDASNIAYIDVEKKQFDQRKLIKGDIIIEKSGGSDKQPVGRPVLFNLDGDFSFSNFTSALRIEDHHDIYSNYLYKYLKYVYFSGATKAMQSNTTGLHNLDFSKFKALLIPIAPLSDQQRIVAELDCLNEMIAVKQEQLKEFDKLAQSIFYDMFGEVESNSKGFELMRLDKVCNLKAGKAIKAEELQEESDGLFPCYGGNGIRGYINRYSHDGIYPIIGRQGALCGNINLAQGKFYATEHAVVVSSLVEMDSIWLSYALTSMKLEKYAHGVAQPGLSVKDLNPLLIPLPPLSLQQQFSEKISAIEAQKELVKQSIAETQALLDYTMDKYFG